MGVPNSERRLSVLSNLQSKKHRILHHEPQFCLFVFKLLCFALTFHVNKHSERLMDHSYTNI